LPHAHTVRLQIVAADVSGRAAIDGQAKRPIFKNCRIIWKMNKCMKIHQGAISDFF
jgi:hypothetical protein